VVGSTVRRKLRFLLTWHLADDSVPSEGIEATFWVDDGLNTDIPPSVVPPASTAFLGIRRSIWDRPGERATVGWQIQQGKREPLRKIGKSDPISCLRTKNCRTIKRVLYRPETGSLDSQQLAPSQQTSASLITDPQEPFSRLISTTTP